MIYLDNNATTPMLPEVFEAMKPWFGVPANPSSIHAAGQRAAAAVEEAREAIAALIGGASNGVVFTSGATEANHMALRGLRPIGDQNTLLQSAIEHPSAKEAAQRCALNTRQLPVNSDGTVQLPAQLDANVRAISLMAVNHETGVIQPYEALLRVAKNAGRFVHIDATAAAGKLSLQLADADAVVLSAHKLGGPNGVGALILKNGDPFPPLLSGGSQERGRRAGTLNVAGIVGFAAACKAAHRDLHERHERWTHLQSQLEGLLLRLGAHLVGQGTSRAANTICVTFPGLSGESMVQSLDLNGVCASSGAACSSGSLDPSPVLVAMRSPHPGNVLRFSLGPQNTAHEIEAALPIIERTLTSLITANDWLNEAHHATHL